MASRGIFLLLAILAIGNPKSCETRKSVVGKAPGLHITSVLASQPADIDLAIVMLDNRRVVPADRVAREKEAPCDDYWSAAVAINRMYAELHGYHFYMWHDTHNAVRASGCLDNDPWLAKALGSLLNPKVVHPAWQKMVPVYCHLKQHKLVLWLDSDAYVSDIHLPLETLLQATRFLQEGKSMLIANDHPKNARCKGCSRESGPGLNTGMFVLRQGEVALELLRNWMGATFPQFGDPEKVKVSARARMHWPWEQTAVNTLDGPSVYSSYKDHTIVLPYATPINGPHGKFMVHLWGFITGYGKKCKVLRAALKCTLEQIPDSVKACYLRHISASHPSKTPIVQAPVASNASNPFSFRSIVAQAMQVGGLDSGGGACGWRSGPELLNPTHPKSTTTKRYRCLPTCERFSPKLAKRVQSDTEYKKDDAIAPYTFSLLGLKQCASKLVSVKKQQPQEIDKGNPSALWNSMVQDTDSQ